MNKEERAAVAEVIRTSPLTYAQLAKEYQCHRQTINNIAMEFDLPPRKRGPRPASQSTTSNTEVQ
jgi:hypothetical protein